MRIIGYYNICETQDTLILNSNVAKGMPGRAKDLPDTCYALPTSLQKGQDTLIEQLYILLMQSVTMQFIYSHSCIDVILSLTQ